jgi:hypothetical protein
MVVKGKIVSLSLGTFDNFVSGGLFGFGGSVGNSQAFQIIPNKNKINMLLVNHLIEKPVPFIVPLH